MLEYLKAKIIVSVVFLEIYEYFMEIYFNWWSLIYRS
jgi:hypothetical protein